MTKYMIAAATLIQLAASPPAIGSELKVAAPESVGMSSERLARIGSVMQQFVDDGVVAGTVTLVSRRGRIVHIEAHGYRDLKSKSQMATDVIFRIASMTKPITSVALMMLWEEGKVNLFDPVSKYLPEFADVKVSTTGDASGNTGSLAIPKSPMNIRQLLTHTSGLASNHKGNVEYYREQVMSDSEETLEQRVKRIARLPLNYHPGDEWQYSHATDVIARIVEVVSAMPFQDFLKTRIFNPISMKETSHYLDADKANRLATLYRYTDKLLVTDAGSTSSSIVSGPKNQFRGAGGLVTTVTDYFQFLQMMLNGGKINGNRLLGGKTVDLMLSNQIGQKELFLPTPPRPGLGFGLGFAVVVDRGAYGVPTSTGTAFWGGAYGTRFWIDPEEELIAIFMAQIQPYNVRNIRIVFRNLVYQAIVD